MSKSISQTKKHRQPWLKRWLSLFSLSLVVLPITAPMWDIAAAVAQNIPAAVQRAFTLLGQGRVNDAIAAFQQALKQIPQSLQAKLGLAIAYRRAGRDADAWNTYQQVLAQDPNNQLALKTVGLLGSYRQEWQPRGIQALTTLLNLNPNDTEARAQRALLYGYQRRFVESLADYQIVLQNNPSPEAIIGAAEIYTYSGNSQQGLELFNRYRATGKPITGYAAVAYARALRETGNPGAAIQVLQAQLQRSNTLDDLAIQARAQLSQAYLANGQQAEALAVLQPLQDNPNAILPLARSLNEIRRNTNTPNLTEQIANLYRQALASNPNPSPTLLREAADVFSGLPQGEQAALQIYRQLAVQLPNDKSLLVQQIALENQLGLLSRNDLKQRLFAALQPLPTDRVQLQQIAQALVKLDSPEPELLPIYQNLVQSGVNEPFLNFRIAQILIERNDTPGARQALAAYVATPAGARDLAPQLLAAEIERREGNLEASAQRYQALINSNQGDSDIQNAALRGIAGVRLQQQRLDEALGLYDQLIARNPQDANLQLGRASIAYQAKRISAAQAEAVLNNWLATQPATNRPPELFSLVGALPPDPQRESLYNSLVEIDPSNIPLQLRLVQVLAQRNPAQARARVNQLIANAPQNVGAYFLQGQLAQAVGDLELAGRAYENILAQQPNNVDALSALGGIRFQERRFESAQQIYSEVLELKPGDRGARQAIAGLTAIADQPLAALEQLEQLQLEQIASGGTPDRELSRQMQQLQEDFLLRRGFQPPWESYDRRNRN